MRLYLSSFLLGNHPEKFTELVESGRHLMLILNALDNRQKIRDEFLDSQTKALSDLGFLVEELDLRAYFGRQNELMTLLKSTNALG